MVGFVLTSETMVRFPFGIGSNRVSVASSGSSPGPTRGGGPREGGSGIQPGEW